VRWPEARAGLIAIAIGFGLVDGCPIPPPEETLDWQKPFVEPIRTVRNVVETPMAWVVPTLRVAQRWALYQAPGEHRYRVWIEGRTADGAWHLVFRAGDPAHAEDAAVLDSARVWGAYDPLEIQPPQYRAFCAWFTARVLAGHPEFQAARVRQEPITIVPGGFEASGKFVFEFVRTRGVP
jgi:hypothetical protein